MPRTAEAAGPAMDGAPDPREESIAEHLIGRYMLEAELYERLLEIAREQGELLETAGGPPTDAIERCTELFERKEQYLNSVAEIERESEPLKRRWWREEVAAGERQQLNTLLDQILATIEAIMEQEQHNEQLLLECQRQARAAFDSPPYGGDTDAAATEPSVVDVSR